MEYLYGEQYGDNATKKTRFANNIAQIREHLQETPINSRTTIVAYSKYSGKGTSCARDIFQSLASFHLLSALYSNYHLWQILSVLLGAKVQAGSTPVPLLYNRNAPSLPKAFAKGIDGALGSLLCSLAHYTPSAACVVLLIICYRSTLTRLISS
jgi:hypothetical protein